jgi:hypothetical protein
MRARESMATRLAVTLLGWLPRILTLTGVAVAFWLVWSKGPTAWTLLALVVMALASGVVVALEVIVEDRLAQSRSTRRSESNAPLEGYRSVARIGASVATMSLGLMLILPAATALVLCSELGGTGRGFGRCLELWTNRGAWWLFGMGIVAFVAHFAIHDEEKTGMRRILRRRSDRARRRRKREEAELAKSVHEDVSS